MNTRIFLVASAGFLFLAGPLYCQSTTPGRLRAGAAKVDITPKKDQLKLATDSIRDPLYVRAIFADDGTSCAALISVDGGARDAVVDDAISRASASAGCPAANFIISGTHSHSATTGGLGGAGFPTAKTVADAIVSAVMTAKSKLAPARVGYGTTRLDLNVNRDMFTKKLEWRQEPNPDGPSDKTLAVVEFVGEDRVPIGVYMNYAMHPINFYLSGVISADFPGEACRFVEETYDNRPVAVFSQGASGDQNPVYRTRRLSLFRTGAVPPPETVRSTEPQPGSGGNFNAGAAESDRKPIPPENMDAYRKAIAYTGELVTMMGTSIGAAAVQLMRDVIQPVNTAGVWAGQERFTCPGRERLDAANPARENVFPGYKEGADVNLKVGLLRIGDVNFVSVNGEVYSQIATRLKAEAPANKTMVVSLANGAANSGYIYSDDAYSHLTFQVIGSRLKPGCAEDRIISTAFGLMHRSGE